MITNEKELIREAKTRQIIELESLFNEFYMVKDNYCISISGLDENKTVILSMFEKETHELLFDLQIDYVEDMYRFITSFINHIYNDYINQLEKCISGWSAFSKRKTRSLRLWSERNDTNKISEINKEMIAMYTQIEEAKKQKDFYKQFVHIFYTIRNYSINRVA